jgi:hypothetical protein
MSSLASGTGGARRPHQRRGLSSASNGANVNVTSRLSRNSTDLDLHRNNNHTDDESDAQSHMTHSPSPYNVDAVVHSLIARMEDEDGEVEMTQDSDNADAVVNNNAHHNSSFSYNSNGNHRHSYLGTTAGTASELSMLDIQVQDEEVQFERTSSNSRAAASAATASTKGVLPQGVWADDDQELLAFTQTHASQQGHTLYSRKGGHWIASTICQFLPCLMIVAMVVVSVTFGSIMHIRHSNNAIMTSNDDSTSTSTPAYTGTNSREKKELSLPPSGLPLTCAPEKVTQGQKGSVSTALVALCASACHPSTCCFTFNATENCFSFGENDLICNAYRPSCSILGAAYGGEGIGPGTDSGPNSGDATSSTSTPPLAVTLADTDPPPNLASICDKQQLRDDPSSCEQACVSVACCFDGKAENEGGAGSCFQEYISTCDAFGPCQTLTLSEEEILDDDFVLIMSPSELQDWCAGSDMNACQEACEEASCCVATAGDEGGEQDGKSKQMCDEYDTEACFSYRFCEAVVPEFAIYMDVDANMEVDMDAQYGYGGEDEDEDGDGDSPDDDTPVDDNNFNLESAELVEAMDIQRTCNFLYFDEDPELEEDCRFMCELAECCIVDVDQSISDNANINANININANCLNDNRNICAKFAPCVSVNDAFSVVADKLYALVDAPPDTIEDYCNEDYLNSSGAVGGLCESICEVASCCVEPHPAANCLDEYSNTCQMYAACSLVFDQFSGITTTVLAAPISDLAQVCDPALLQDITMREDCEDGCAPAKCCFLPISDPDYCQTTPSYKDRCDEYAEPCQALYAYEYVLGDGGKHIESYLNAHANATPDADADAIMNGPDQEARSELKFICAEPALLADANSCADACEAALCCYPDETGYTACRDVTNCPSYMPCRNLWK